MCLTVEQVQFKIENMNKDTGDKDTNKHIYSIATIWKTGVSW
jgi:hypothetical protein